MNILINSGKTYPFLASRKQLVLDIILKGHKVFISGFQKEYKTQIEQLGANFIYVKFERNGLNIISDFLLYLKYKRIIRKHKIDVVHSYTIKPNIYGTLAAKKNITKGVFPTVNGVGYVFSDNSIKAKTIRIFIRFLYMKAFKNATKVFFHNSDDLELFTTLRIIKRGQGLVINGSGIDLDYFYKTDITEDDHFLFASRLLKSKGIIEFIKAAEIVKERHPNASFIIAGSFDTNPRGLKYQDLTKLVKENCVEFIGNVADIRVAIKNASVVVLPSYREGVPHILLEALSMGRPIITTNVPGCKETVICGINGFLVEKYDHQILAQKMCFFLENKEVLSSFGNESRLLAESKFSLKVINEIIK
ncbi:MAG: glycosyltransferase family 4 protein, partial [Bacilli bacterium]